MTKMSVERKFKGLTDENYRMILNFRKSLYWKEVKETTLYEYSKSVYKFMLFLQDKNIDTVDANAELLQEYIDTLEVTAKRKLKVVSAINIFYKSLREKRVIKKNLVAEFDTGELRAEMLADKIKKEKEKKKE